MLVCILDLIAVIVFLVAGAESDEPVTRPLIKSPSQGGENGTAFDDLKDFYLTP